jgi:hypothetical protein
VNRKTGWIFAAIGVVVLAVLFVLLRPQRGPDDEAARAPGVATGGLPVIVQLVVKGGRLASGPSVIQVTQGSEVLIDVVADQPDELHVHGYDLKADLQPGAPAQLRFVADKTGRFEYELHRAQSEIGALEVLPK